MRLILMITVIATLVTVFYKWRYRVVNTLLAISFLRRIVVAITMNMPAIRQKILPKVFSQSANS